MKVPLLMYHRVGDDSAERRFTVPTTLFKRQMCSLKGLGYQIVSLDDIIAALQRNTALPPKSVAITFDDGFQDTFENAVPVLKDLGYTATFFLVSRLMGATNVWMQPQKQATFRLMDWMSAKELLKYGFHVGSHSRNHPSLTQLDDRKLSDEVEGSRRDLEDRLGAPIRHFAYPYGHFNDRTRHIVESCRYTAACSTQSGFNSLSTNPYGLRRLEINNRDSKRIFTRSLAFGQNHMRATQAIRYYFWHTLGLVHDKGARLGA
jgi:peptidoglycan/xylan/chitin deacetylase (PgdA/CDA1 family)